MGDPTSLIALDWGTTQLRVYRVGAEGEVLDAMESPNGILRVPAGGFDAVFESTIEPWLEEARDVPVIAAGMVGSRQGWREVPYLPCPAGVTELAGRLATVRTRRGRMLWLVPGLMVEGTDGIPDVERGEEAQVLGAIPEGATGSSLVVIPGTHSKWIVVEAGRVAWFATFMTGELFAVLADHSILGRLMEGEADDADAFVQGLDVAARDKDAHGGLLRRLFSVRTLGLFGRIPPTGIRSYLSGLLIGTEIREAKACVAARLGHGPKAVILIAGPRLAPPYRRALGRAGLESHDVDAAATARGLWRIAAGGGLLGRR